MDRQFWVIGAEYGDFHFVQPLDGTPRVIGPFASYQEASTVWREHSMASRSKALTRYTIVSNVAASHPAAMAVQ